MTKRHNRQSVILAPQDYDQWLSAEATVPEAKGILTHHLGSQRKKTQEKRDASLGNRDDWSAESS